MRATSLSRRKGLAGDASRDPFDELSALSRGFTAAKARLTDDALDHAADYVAERTARLAAEAQVAQLQAAITKVETLHRRVRLSPSVSECVTCIREWPCETADALAAATSGVAPDQPNGDKR